MTMTHDRWIASTQGTLVVVSFALLLVTSGCLVHYSGSTAEDMGYALQPGIAPPQAAINGTNTEPGMDVGMETPDLRANGTDSATHEEKPDRMVEVTREVRAGKTEAVQAPYETLALADGSPSDVKGAVLPEEQVKAHDAVEVSRRLAERERQADPLPEEDETGPVTKDGKRPMNPSAASTDTGDHSTVHVGSLSSAEPLVDIPVDTRTVLWNISDRLVGLHMVYTFVPDWVYADGKIAAWARRSGISTSRYPGGTIVKYWDWENPSGQPWIDNYAPSFDPAKNLDGSEWMSLDEYLAFVEASGIHPHFGVNMASASVPGPYPAIYPLISESDCIARAVRMVRYVKERGHGGAWWYLGNEEVHWHGGIDEYAKVCARYAQAMKAVDPDIKLFWNDNGGREDRIRDFLNNDGGWMDGLETHGKWPYGGSGDHGHKTLSDWQNDFPLEDYRHSRKWRHVAENQYRKAARDVGRSILVANNEYGWGLQNRYSGFTRYTKGLLMTEFLGEMFQGNWDMSCFWDMRVPDSPGDDNVLEIGNGSYRFNPFHFGMNMLADAQGGEFLAQLRAGTETTLHGFAARKDGVLLVYLLNKGDKTRPVRLQLQGASYPAAFARRMQDSAEGYGELVSFAVQGDGSSFTCDLPPFTFTQFVFADPATFLEITGMVVSSHVASLSWTSLPGATFAVEQSTNLEDWTDAQSDIAPDNLWTDSKIDVGSGDRLFFRIRLQP